MGATHCTHLSDVKHTTDDVVNHLPDVQQNTDKAGNHLKNKLLRCTDPNSHITNKIFSQTKAQKKDLWKRIGGMNGAHLLSLHFYRRIYDNDDQSAQKNDKIKKFCTLFTDRPFSDSVDRVAIFMATELNGEGMNYSWVNAVHATHAKVKHIMSPLSGQMWLSFLCSALNDVDFDENLNKELLTFFKDWMVFLFMDTWTECKDKLDTKTMEGLINESKDRVPSWENEYNK
eukprot:501845_1